MITIAETTKMRKGDIIWKTEYPDRLYEFVQMCKRQDHSQPCFIVRHAKTAETAHLGRWYWSNKTWVYRSSCMFGKEAEHDPD